MVEGIAGLPAEQALGLLVRELAVRQVSGHVENLERARQRRRFERAPHGQGRVLAGARGLSQPTDDGEKGTVDRRVGDDDQQSHAIHLCFEGQEIAFRGQVLVGSL